MKTLLCILAAVAVTGCMTVNIYFPASDHKTEPAVTIELISDEIVTAVWAG